MFTSSFVKRSTSSKHAKPGSHDAQQNLWTAVALQQHMLRQLDEQGRAPAELRPPRPLPEGRLSLAQKMGLVDRPPDAPNAESWSVLETQSTVRGDLARPCAICCMPFSAAAVADRRQNAANASSSSSTPSPSSLAEQPIILSCSHCFHAQCLRQLEKHARSTRQKRKCPVCRHESYFRRKFEAAPAILQTAAVTKIQAVFRGHRARKFFIRLKMKIDPQFRSDYYYKKLRQLTDARMADHAAHEMEVDQTMEEIDYVMEISAVSRFDEILDWRDKVAKCALEREFLDCPVCLCSMKEEIQKEQQERRKQQSSTQGNFLGRILENWDDLWKKKKMRSATTVREQMLLAKEREKQAQEALQKANKSKLGAPVVATTTSTITAGRRRTSSSISSISSASKVTKNSTVNVAATVIPADVPLQQQEQQPPSELEMVKLNRAIVLTSCSHLYHAACLRSMEMFGGGANNRPKCACCRKGYLKRLLFENDE